MGWVAREEGARAAAGKAVGHTLCSQSLLGALLLRDDDERTDLSEATANECGGERLGYFSEWTNVAQANKSWAI